MSVCFVPGVHEVVDDGVDHGVGHGQPVEDEVHVLYGRIGNDLLVMICVQ